MARMLLSVGLFLISGFCWAQTCPSVASIKNDKIKGWVAYDMYGKTLSTKENIRFKEHALEFALAEVTQHANKLAVRCLYRDKSGSNLEAYLAKDNIVADNTKNYWYSVSGSTHCAAGVSLCQFNNIPLTQTQLAENQ